MSLFRMFQLFVAFSVFYCYSSFALNNTSAESQTSWPRYSEQMPQFDYSGDKLLQHWTLLAAGTELPWPDAVFVKDMMLRFPEFKKQLLTLAQAPKAHPALVATLTENYAPLAEALQQVWRLHFQGEFQQAYELGMKLGPAGILPAVYSKLIHTTFLIKEIKNKTERFLQVDEITKRLLPLAPDYRFLIFGDAYQQARRLEMLSTSAATVSGLLGPTQKALKKLRKKSPDNALYMALLAGIDAGIIERVGGFVGGMTYGADEDRAIELFNQAIKQESRLAVLFNEYSQALIRLDDSDYDKVLDDLLKRCLALPVYSAEEALNQQACKETNNLRNSRAGL